MWYEEESPNPKARQSWRLKMLSCQRIKGRNTCKTYQVSYSRQDCLFDAVPVPPILESDVVAQIMGCTVAIPGYMARQGMSLWRVRSSPCTDSSLDVFSTRRRSAPDEILAEATASPSSVVVVNKERRLRQGQLFIIRTDKHVSGDNDAC